MLLQALTLDLLDLSLFWRIRPWQQPRSVSMCSMPEVWQADCSLASTGLLAAKATGPTACRGVFYAIAAMIGKVGAFVSASKQ